MKKCLLLRRPRNKRAFTLIELMIVISIVAIIAFLTSSYSRYLNRLIVRAELEHLHSVCFYVQRRALVTNTIHTLELDSSKHMYRIGEKEYYLPAHVQFGVVNGAKGPPSSPHHLITNAISFKDSTITFHPDGVIKPGVVYITDSSRACGYALSSSVSLVSYLRKYQYTTNGWELLD